MRAFEEVEHGVRDMTDERLKERGKGELKEEKYIVSRRLQPRAPARIARVARVTRKRPLTRPSLHHHPRFRNNSKKTGSHRIEAKEKLRHFLERRHFASKKDSILQWVFLRNVVAVTLAHPSNRLHTYLILKWGRRGERRRGR